MRRDVALNAEAGEVVVDDPNVGVEVPVFLARAAHDLFEGDQPEVRVVHTKPKCQRDRTGAVAGSDLDG